ncbi:MAG: SMI1/KNR4 family protein [Propionibacteriaceae bacterium]|nr:SMI1/KNR4 family protein [Propionibacteriaceae bacterium]
MTERMTGFFDGMDFTGFWNDHPYYAKNYTEPAPSDELIADIEAELGFRLPVARIRNGGGVARDAFPMTVPTNWADDHVRVTGIYAIGRTRMWSLLGDLGSTFHRDEWGYPSWGVSFASTPTAGHEQFMLDYRDCGAQGEPSVVYVDQEADYKVTPVAPDFASFIRGLVDPQPYDEALEAEFSD